MTDTERSYSGTVVAAILLALMVGGITYRYWPSDERSIRRHLSNLAEALSFPSPESGEARLTRIAVLREYFAPDVRVRLDDRELTSRDEIIGLLSRFQPPPGGVNVEFVDITIALADDQESATVTLTAKLSSTNSNGESTLDERVTDVTMRKLDDDWVIASAMLRAAATNVRSGVSRTVQTTGSPLSVSFSISFAIPTTLSSPSMSINLTPCVARPIARTSSVSVRRIMPCCVMSRSSSPA
jgi:hypothetical protein